MIGAFCRHFTNSTYSIPVLNFSMTFVRYGTIASKKRRGNRLTLGMLQEISSRISPF
ncbi:hypothetical protein BGY98DRAFT_974920, partial [Russula aff. rugulosa BPL654]